MQVSNDVREKVQKELQTMLYAKSDNQYDKCLLIPMELASAKFCDYFIKNWDTVKSKWVRYIVDANGDLGNHRIEAYHSAIKRFLPAKLSVTDMVHCLQLYNEGICDVGPQCSALSDDEGSMQR